MNQPEIPLYTSGTVLLVGTHHAKVIKYLTSGGFAQVYTAEIFSPDSHSGSTIACLKRLIVPDKGSLNSPRAEVDAMKLLRNNNHVVSYIDSHAAKSTLQNGSYEVLLLMEYCAGGGLIDFMNKRLQNRLQEFEVLNIMSHVTQGVAAMHSLDPPLLHRDIKIENVLISNRGEYKVCDFGSVCGIIRPPSTSQELSYVQHDVLKNTTAQYRAPEMIDLYRGLPIDEKSDIWALGVFLYKLCYYTTPFEKEGEQAILHSRYKYPAYPRYNDRMKNLIRVMLMENPVERPNVCQVLEEVARMQGIPCPLKNFYLERAIRESIPTSDHLLSGQPQQVEHANYGHMMQYSMSFPSVTAMSLHMPVVNNNIIPNISISNRAQHMLPLKKSNMSMPINTKNSLMMDSEQVIVPEKLAVENEFSRLHNTKSLSDSRSGSSLNAINQVQKTGRGNISKIIDSNPTILDKRSGSFPEKVSKNIVNGSSSSSNSSLDFDNNQSLNEILNHSMSLKLDDTNNFNRSSKENSKPNLTITDNDIYTFKHDSLRSIDKTSDVDRISVSPFAANNESKDSIQNRVRNLIENSDDIPITRNALGYGKYTGSNEHSKTQNSIISNTGGSLTQSFSGTSKLHKKKAAKPVPASKPCHLRPKKPPKPAYLIGKLKSGNSDRNDGIIDKDNENEVEQLEKEFNKRFPSIS